MSAVQSIGAAAAAAVAGEVLAAGKSIRVAANVSAAAATAADTLNFRAQASSFSTSAANELVEHATRSLYVCVCLCVTAVDITANQSNKEEDAERRKG